MTEKNKPEEVQEAMISVGVGTAIGASASAVVGGMGLAVGGTALGVGMAPVAAAGAVRNQKSNRRTRRNGNWSSGNWCGCWSRYISISWRYGISSRGDGSCSYNGSRSGSRSSNWFSWVWDL